MEKGVWVMADKTIYDVYEEAAKKEVADKALADNLYHLLIAVERGDEDRREPSVRTDLAETLVGALLIALPYVEDAIMLEDFKPGVVKRHVAIIRAALEKAGVK